MGVVEEILDLARWAPSGDNTQPWRFEIVDQRHVAVHGFDTREHVVYDKDGRASQLALGALLETLGIAASGHGLRARCVRRRDAPEERPVFDVLFEADGGVGPSPLLPFVSTRTVQRRAMAARPLAAAEKRDLAACLGPGWQVTWWESLAGKRRMAGLMFRNARIRLTMPEAYEVHRSVIEWGARYSEDRIPDQAVGLDPVATRLMRWVMGSWSRVEFFNTWLAGTLVPRLELDWLPGIACGAHFALLAPQAPDGIDAYVEAGRRVQRFWLTATRLGLQLQPEMTPLIFARFVRQGIRFSGQAAAVRAAAELAGELEALLGPEAMSRAVFLGRIGHGKPARARSLRLPLSRLLVSREDG